MRIINAMKSFEFIEFEKEDIVRSALVKEYIVSEGQSSNRYLIMQLTFWICG
jgi:phosphate starvation-inducible protein PhoH